MLLHHLPLFPKTPLLQNHFLSPVPKLHIYPRPTSSSRTFPIAPRAQLLPSIQTVQSVASATSVLAAIILVHESGHFLAATLQGIHVSKFSLGFGPVLTRFVANDVEFSVRAFPLGGFVGFPDDDPESDYSADDPDLLRNRPIFDRFLVISAGVIANIIFAYAIIFSQVVIVGLPVQEPLAGILVSDVRSNSAAERDGLRVGDVIVSSSGITDLVDAIKLNPKKQINFNVLRKEIDSADNQLKIDVTPDESVDGTGRIGVQLSPNYKLSKIKAKNLMDALNFSNREFLGLSKTVFDGLKNTFMNFSQSASKVSGPVAIIAVGAEVARSSVDGLFQFAAIININLAAINLLPLPALDGGSLALLAVEAVRGGRKIPKEIEQRIMGSGILVVLGMGLFLIVKDTLSLDFIKENL